MSLLVSRTILAIMHGEVPAYAKVVLDAFHDAGGEGTQADLESRLVELERDVRRLEDVARHGERVSGHRLAVLEQVFRASLDGGRFGLTPDELLGRLPLSLTELKEAIAELVLLDLVATQPNMNHLSGIARVSLSPTAYLRVGAEFLPEIAVGGEVRRTLIHLRDSGVPRVPTETVIQAVGMPIPRADLLFDAMRAYDLVAPGGMSSPAGGRFGHLAPTPTGLRLLRRDITVPWDLA